ncbi:MAG: Ref family recombination enhancement nuclease [Pseudomonadota bacterium]
MKQGSKPLARTPFKSKAAATTKAPAKRATMKTKQRAVTELEKLHWNRLSALGCIACMIDHVHQPIVSIHHVDGRTKPGCHMLVLPLCAEHHQQDDTDPRGRIAVHPNKARFEAKYGTQIELMARCAALLKGFK